MNINSYIKNKRKFTISKNSKNTPLYFGDYSPFSLSANGLINAGWTFSCREEFHENGIDFSFLAKIQSSLPQINKFLNILQTKCKCPPTQRIIVKSTNKKQVWAVFLSDWWVSNEARTQFITIALRCIKWFDGKNFDEAIFTHEYFNVTKTATKRFLSGKTRVTKNGFVDGWVYSFADYDFEEWAIKKSIY